MVDPRHLISDHDAFDLASGLRRLHCARMGSENLNAWMVHEGWALAFVRYSDEYVEEEK
jgi:endonuclease YncB( thermonuclease family)